MEQHDKDTTFTISSIDSINVSVPSKIDELQYDLKMVAMNLLERLTDKKYKSLFSNIVDTFNNINLIKQEFVLEKLKNLIINAQLISDDDLEKLRDIFLNKPAFTYKVGFISPFSYGKSSLINGLLGRSLLKADIRAETAVVTHVTFDDEYSLFFVNDKEVTAARFDTMDQFKEEVEKITSVHTADETVQHLIFNVTL